MSTTTKQTAVVGHPIEHSLSPFFHNAIYAKEGIDASMSAFDAVEIEPFISKIRSIPLHLVAVTLPHKKTVMAFLDEIETTAETIGAVNTVINREGKLFGYNTDIIGIAAALKGIELKDKNVLILGAGGAARPVAYYLKQQGAHIYCQSRTFDKAEALCRHFGGIALHDVDEASALSFDLVINATPLGLKQEDPLPFPLERVRPDSIIFDVIYKPTKLLTQAKAKGARVIPGLTMLIAQGLEQERLWLGREILDSGYTALLQAEIDKREFTERK